MVQLVLPNDANTLGNVLGGRVLHWIDLAAAIVAHRHCRSEAVTASLDQMAFLAPIRVGQLAVIRGRMTRAWRSSMEIRVDVQCEDLLTGMRKPTSTAYLTFVAIDPAGRPADVPPLRLTTNEERREAHAADGRRRARLASRSTHTQRREKKTG
jgi:acyl-CoA hydrolase